MRSQAKVVGCCANACAQCVILDARSPISVQLGNCLPAHPGGKHADGGNVGGNAIDKYTLETPVEVHDLHATILHQLGMDHERLTFRHAGLISS